MAVIYLPELQRKQHVRTGKHHFPDLNNVCSITVYNTNVRRYLPHGYGEDYVYRPLNDPSHFKDLLQYFDEPGKSGDHDVDIDNQTAKVNTESAHKMNVRYTAKNESLGPIELSAATTTSPSFAGLKYLIDRRNRFPVTVPGDKSYYSVEYSPDFYKFGSTVPVVNFSRPKRNVMPLFIPHITERPLSESYIMKKSRHQLEEETNVVKELEHWRPATPLIGPSTTAPTTSNGSALRRQKRTELIT